MDRGAAAGPQRRSGCAGSCGHISGGRRVLSTKRPRHLWRSLCRVVSPPHWVVSRRDPKAHPVREDLESSDQRLPPRSRRLPAASAAASSPLEAMPGGSRRSTAMPVEGADPTPNTTSCICKGARDMFSILRPTDESRSDRKAEIGETPLGRRALATLEGRRPTPSPRDAIESSGRSSGVRLWARGDCIHCGVPAIPGDDVCYACGG